MGTWDYGAFDNDTAADFGGRLDELGPAAVEAVRTVLTEVAEGRGDDDTEAEAVAAAALVAAQLPGAAAVESAYAPKKPLPAFPEEFRPLAVRALDHVLSEGSELNGLWEGSRGWRFVVEGLRSALAA